MTEGKIRNKKLYLNMKNFSDKDIKFLMQLLENKFHLNEIYLFNKFLEFNCNNIKKIYEMTKPFILPSMKFKFII